MVFEYALEEMGVERFFFFKNLKVERFVEFVELGRNDYSQLRDLDRDRLFNLQGATNVFMFKNKNTNVFFYSLSLLKAN